MGFKLRRRRSASQIRSRVNLGSRKTLLEALEPRHLLAADLIISEVMASNDLAHQDDDGASSDYIELFNSGNSAVDLDGWHLTDDVDNRTRWTFPSVSLAPGNALLVYASGNDRRDADKPLHTNFSISRGGEYLGLYEPDGRTPAFEFNELPEQYTDVSYGVGQTLVDREFISSDHPATVYLPTSEANDLPAASWTAAEYDDSTWTARTTGLGFDDDTTDGEFGPYINENGELSMRGSASSAYIRTEFEIAGESPTFEDLQLEIQFDDGFVGYLNGHEVVRMNAPEALSWDSVATQSNGGIAEDLDFPDFSQDESEFTFNGDSSYQGSKLTITPSAANMNGAVWRTEPVQFGSDYTFSASMVFDIHSPGGGFADGDSDGIGGEGVTFVLQSNDNNVLGSGGSSLGLENTGSTFLAIELDSGADGAFDPDDTLPSHLGINTSADGSLARTALGRFNGNGFFPGDPGPGSNFLHVWLDYVGSSNQLDVYYASNDQKPAAPRLSTTVDLNELFAGTPELYAGWTASTTAAFNGHDVTAFDINTGIGEVGIEPIQIDLREHVDKLQSGPNVLAFHGLNVTSDDEDFLLIPKLSGTEVSTDTTKGFFVAPTPGDINGESSAPPSGSVTISEPTQVFSEAFTVGISPETAGATIRYTLDGTLPSEESELYTEPLTISATTRLRARAFEADFSPGPTSTAGYVQASPELVNFEGGGAFESNLPVVIIDSFGNRAVDRDSVKLVPSVGLFIGTGEDGNANLFDEPEYAGRVGARIRGQSSQGWAKRQYAIEFIQGDTDDSEALKSQFTKDLAVSVFGLPAESDWVLSGPYADKTQLNNYLTFKLSREMGQYAPRTRLVEVFINGQASDEEQAMLDFEDDYRGTYMLVEKIKADRNRVDINRLSPSDNSENEISGGYIWKKDKTGAEDLNITTDNGQQVRIVEPGCSDVGRDGDRRNACLTGEISDEQVDWLQAHISEFEAALYGPDFTDPNEGYAKYIDVGSWIDTWLLVEYSKNIDGFRLSTYYHKDQNGKIKQGPAWDYNLAFGNANYLRGGHPDGWYGESISADAYPYWTRLFEDPAFELAVANRWFELRESVLKTDKVLADIDEAVNRLSNGNPNLDKPAEGEPSNPISRNYQRWTNRTYGTDKYHWPNCYFVGNNGDCPKESPLPGGREPETYADHIFLMKRFVDLRSQWIDEQFQNPLSVSPEPGLVSAGTAVEFTAPDNFDLYYTTDGTDPINASFDVIGENNPVEYLVPTSQDLLEQCMGRRLSTPETCFVNPSYVAGTNGESWSTGTLGIGFDAEGGKFQDLVSTNLESELKGVNSVAYLRIPFTFNENITVTDVTLDVQYDDGFVAYLWRNNGSVTEVARSNVPGEIDDHPIETVPFNEISTESRDSTRFESFPINMKRVELLPDANNYLVIQAVNSDPNDNDLFIDARLTFTGRHEEPSLEMSKYTEPLMIDNNTELFVRAFDKSSSQWVRGFRDSYITEVPELTITEVHYNPAPPTDTELAEIPELTADDFEFIEIQNIGSDTNLLNTVFDQGIQYQFDDITLNADAIGVVVNNRDAFQLRYGTDINILGQYTGNLANNGETISLRNAFGSELVEFAYSDNNPWPIVADGNGGSLQLIDPAETPKSLYGKPDSWNQSSRFGGTPGTLASNLFGVAINEVLSRTDPANETDAIELYNSSSAQVDLGGWYLSDSLNDLQKYQIPAGTSIAAGDMLVLREDAFNAEPNGFAFSGTDGDRLWLSTANDSGEPEWLVDYVDFRASLSGESHSRYPNGTGPLAPTAPSLGTTNNYPRVGPVILSEVQYDADAPSEAAVAAFADITSSDLEFIELHNSSDQPIKLTDWRLRGGVDMDFDLEAELASQETAVIVSFNPDRSDNADRTSAFRAHYGISDNVQLIGGFQGRLSGSGERVTLLSRDISLADQPVVLPLVVQDEIIYDNGGTWPSNADGTGMTLTRRDAISYGNLGSSWTAAVASPGTVTFIGLVGDLNGDQLVDIEDVDALCGAIQSGSNDAQYDLDSNGLVNLADQNYLVEEVLNTTAGDANLDGNFDSRDLVLVFTAGLYEQADASATWASGDWNCDGQFTTSDLVASFQAGSYLFAASPISNLAEMSLIAASLHDGLNHHSDATEVDRLFQEHSAQPSDTRAGNLLAQQQQQQQQLAPVIHDRIFAELPSQTNSAHANLDDKVLEKVFESLDADQL